MSWVTVIWSMVASACLTLAAMHLLVWCKNRAAWGSLAFTLAALGVAGTAAGELMMMRSATPWEMGLATVALDAWWAPAGKIRYLALQGSDDQAAPPENGVLLQKDLGDRVTLVTLKGAGHLMLVTRPKEAAKEMVAFLKSLPENKQ